MKHSKQDLRNAHKRAAARATKAAYARGYIDGQQQGHIDKTAWIRCPAEGCDRAIEIPLMLIIDGEGLPAEQQALRAELDSTELWLHMHSHTGKISHDEE